MTEHGIEAEAQNPPRAPYLHPDSQYVSIGFGLHNDSLLKVVGGEGDRERIEAWCNAIVQALRG